MARKKKQEENKRKSKQKVVRKVSKINNLRENSSETKIE